MPRPPVIAVRKARTSDLEAIVALELECFQDYRRASLGSLKRSLASKRQSVWVIDRAGAGAAGSLAALLVLWHFPHTVRVYDIATHPDARGQGLGHKLMAHAESLARRDGCRMISLEAEEADQRLVDWYLGQGFTIVARLRDFYHKGCHAVRMTKPLSRSPA